MIPPLLRQQVLEEDGVEFYMKFTKQKSSLSFDYPSKREEKLKISARKIHQELKKVENTARGAMAILGHFDDEMHEKINMVVANIGFVVGLGKSDGKRERSFITFPVKVKSAVYFGEKAQYRKYADIKEILENRSNRKDLKQEKLILDLLQSAETIMLEKIGQKEGNWRKAVDRSTPEEIENCKQLRNHSETALIYHLHSKEYQKQLVSLLETKITASSNPQEVIEKPKIYAIILDIHSTRVPCHNCAELIFGLQNTQTSGFLYRFKESAKEKFDFPKGVINMITRATADKMGKSRGSVEKLAHRFSITKENMSKRIINYIYKNDLCLFDKNVIFHKDEKTRTIFFSGTQTKFIHYKRETAGRLKQSEAFETGVTGGDHQAHFLEMIHKLQEGRLGDLDSAERSAIALLKKYPELADIQIGECKKLGENGETVLHVALGTGSLSLAFEIIKLKKQLVNAAGRDGRLPIHAYFEDVVFSFTDRCDCQWSSFARYLPTSIKGLDYRDCDGNSLLHNILSNGDTLLKSPDCWESILQLLNYLLDKRPHLAFKSNKLNTYPLHLICRFPKFRKVFKGTPLETLRRFYKPELINEVSHEYEYRGTPLEVLKRRRVKPTRWIEFLESEVRKYKSKIDDHDDSSADSDLAEEEPNISFEENEASSASRSSSSEQVEECLNSGSEGESEGSNKKRKIK